MLRIHIMQLVYNLSIPAMEEVVRGLIACTLLPLHLQRGVTLVVAGDQVVVEVHGDGMQGIPVDQAIRGMTKSMACLSTKNGYGIRCNSIHPGNMCTPVLQGVQDIVRAHNPKAAQEMDNLWVGEPVAVAKMVLFLASDESISVNGAALVIDITMTITTGVVTKK